MNDGTEKRPLKDFIHNLPKEPCFTLLPNQFCVLCSHLNNDVASNCIKGGKIPSKLRHLKKAQLIDIAECLDLATEGTKENLLEMIIAETEKAEVEFEEIAPSGEEEIISEEIETPIDSGEKGKVKNPDEKSLSGFLGDLPKEPCFSLLPDEYCILCSHFNEDVAISCIKGGNIASKLKRQKKTHLVEIAECFGVSTEGPKDELIGKILSIIEERKVESEKKIVPQEAEPEVGEVEKRQDGRSLFEFLEDLPKEPCFSLLSDKYCILCSHFNKSVASACMKGGHILTKLNNIDENQIKDIAECLGLSAEGTKDDLILRILAVTEESGEEVSPDEVKIEFEEVDTTKEEVGQTVPEEAELEFEDVPALRESEEVVKERVVTEEADLEFEEIEKPEEGEGEFEEEIAQEEEEPEVEEVEKSAEERSLSEFLDDPPIEPCFFLLPDQYCIICSHYNDDVASVCVKGGQILSKLKRVSNEHLIEIAECLGGYSEGTRNEIINRILAAMGEAKVEFEEEAVPEKPKVETEAKSALEEMAKSPEEITLIEFLDDLPIEPCFSLLPDQHCIICTHFNDDVASFCVKGGQIPTKLARLKKALLIEIAECIGVSNEGTKNELIERIKVATQRALVEVEEMPEPKAAKVKIKEAPGSPEEITLYDFLNDLPTQPCFTPLPDSYCILCSQLNQDVASACIKGGQPISKLKSLRKAHLVDIAKCLGLSTDRTKIELIEDILGATESLVIPRREVRKEEDMIEAKLPTVPEAAPLESMGVVEAEVEEIKEPEIEKKCPDCGAILEPGISQCPDCGFDFEVAEEMDLHKEEFECPECGTEFKEPVPVCPKCGTEFEGVEEEPEEFECPDCGSIVTSKESICPWCGLEFDEETEEEEVFEEEREGEEFVPIMEEKSLVRHEIEDEGPIKTGLSTGMTNGLTETDRGMTNGLTNGLTNGFKRRRKGVTNGLTNGITNGLTNGLRALRTGITNGLTNGNGITNGLSPRKNALRKTGNRVKLILVPVIIFILILAPYMFVNFHKPQKGIEIDGKFGDWETIEILSESEVIAPFNKNINIVDYGVDSRLQELSFYLQVEGNMLEGESESPGRHMDSAYIFIDSDQQFLSGYEIEGMGADFMVKVEGWQGDIYSSSLWSYISDSQDWNLWEMIGQVSAAVSNNELEVQLDYNALNLKNHDTVDVLFYMQSHDKSEDFSDTLISNEKGVLSIKQQGVGEDVISGSGNKLLRLEIEALNADITLNTLRAYMMGIISGNDISEIRLEQENGQSIGTGTINDGVVTFQPGLIFSEGNKGTYYLEVDIADNAISGNSIGFKISNRDDLITDTGIVSLQKQAPSPNYNEVSYIKSVPQEIIIDGAFADWQDKDVYDDNIGEVANENVDIIEYGFSNTTQMISFYLRVDGEIGFGKAVPYWNDASVLEPSEPGEPPGPASTTPPTPPPRTGEDLSYIFIDNDNESASGYSIDGIGAEYLIGIRGKYGEIISNIYMEFHGANPFEWLWVEKGNVFAKTDSARLETQLLLSDLEITEHFRVYFQTTDWSESEKDYSGEIITRSSFLFEREGNGVMVFFENRGTRGTANELWAYASLDIITVDGDWGSSEWTTYDFYETTNLMIYVQANVNGNLYVCVRVKTDTTTNVADFCEIVFDTDNGDEGSPSNDDYKFNASDSTSFDTFEDYQGILGVWNPGYVSPYAPLGIAERDPDLIDGNYITYEFRIDYREVWFPTPPGSGQEAGFAIRVHDKDANGGLGEDYYWGSSDLDTPSSWGSLYYIPEFQDIIIPTFCTILIGIFYTKRKQKMEKI